MFASDLRTYDYCYLGHSRSTRLFCRFLPVYPGSTSPRLASRRRQRYIVGDIRTLREENVNISVTIASTAWFEKSRQ